MKILVVAEWDMGGEILVVMEWFCRNGFVGMVWFESHMYSYISLVVMQFCIHLYLVSFALG